MNKYSHTNITIYNKGLNNDFYKPPFSKTFKIPNPKEYIYEWS